MNDDRSYPTMYEEGLYKMQQAIIIELEQMRFKDTSAASDEYLLGVDDAIAVVKATRVR